MKKCTSFEEQKGTRYIRENRYFGIIIFSCFSSTKACLRLLLNSFVREIKGFYQSSLGNKVDFRDIRNVSQNILAKNENFKKSRYGFVDERALKNPCIFLLAKEKAWKRIFNTNSELSQNWTENKIMRLKTTVNCLFNDIRCYLIIDCFDWKISIFQQTVVRGLLYPYPETNGYWMSSVQTLCPARKKW